MHLAKHALRRSPTVVQGLAQVCINITPWNAPATITLANAVSMLAAGNHATGCKHTFLVLFQNQTELLDSTCNRGCYQTPGVGSYYFGSPAAPLHTAFDWKHSNGA